MLITGTFVGVVLGLAAWQTAGPAQERGDPPDHTHELRNPDGTWKYTNRLADSTSPYLPQHAHNPVDWYPWGEEAFRAAREADKPIFLSVGYSTCYWCHVMEREVFENPEIAAVMNDRFINIKVDREQRPDVDEIYMTATQLMTRGGGWPMSVFLTPDLKPFFAGTYFGPEDRAGRPGFPTIADGVHEAWRNRRDELLDVADRLTTAIRATLLDRMDEVDPVPLTHAIPDGAVTRLARSYDDRWGGFGAAPKFPQGFNYPFLLAVHARTGEAKPLEMTTHSLRMMAAGGMYDHVGGGFHRYSTDGKWYVPHFEKMLYNQAQLARASLGAYQATNDAAFADLTRDIFRYVEELMTGPEGQFYSALDAETDAVEGAYYVWNREQIVRILAGDDLDFFESAFDIAQVPAFAGHKHPDGGALHLRKPLNELAAELGMDEGSLRARLDDILAKLKRVRDGRELPRLDDKVIAGWNGMMIAAYAQAGRLLGNPAYTESARRAAAFLLEHLRDEEGNLFRVRRAGISEQSAFLDDYGFVVQGLASLYRTTGEDRWLDAARDLADRAHRLFGDPSGGGYFYAVSAPDLIARSKSARDGAIPSGNSAMAHALLDLAELDRPDPWRPRAEEILTAFSGMAAGVPTAHLRMIHAIERFLDGPDPEASGADPVEFELPRVEDAPRGAAPVDSSSHVTLTAELEPAEVTPGRPFTVRIRLDVASGWHINANPASAPFLIPTTADVRSELPITLEEVSYPEPVRLRTAVSENPIDVYEGGVEIVATCRLAEQVRKSDQQTVRVVVGYQACDDTRCLKPAEEVVTLPLKASD